MVDAVRIPQEKKEKWMQSPKLSSHKANQYKMGDYQVKHGYQRKWCSNYHRLKIMWKNQPWHSHIWECYTDDKCTMYTTQATTSLPPPCTSKAL